MAGKLIVILGAGASYDCSSGLVETRPEWRPPLVTDLFDSRAHTFAPILNEYPLAEAAAAEMRWALRDDAVALEEFRRTKLRDSTDR